MVSGTASCIGPRAILYTLSSFSFHGSLHPGFLFPSESPSFGFTRSPPDVDSSGVRIVVPRRHQRPTVQPQLPSSCLGSRLGVFSSDCVGRSFLGVDCVDTSWVTLDRPSADGPSIDCCDDPGIFRGDLGSSRFRSRGRAPAYLKGMPYGAEARGDNHSPPSCGDSCAGR